MVTLKKTDDEKISVQGHVLHLSNVDKVFWKEEKYTKGDLIQYYHSIAPVILPYLKDRPMVMRRNPNGISEEGFFQKNTSTLHLPSWIKTIDIQHEEKMVQYLIVQNEATLLYIVNLGCIELHPFNSRIHYLEYPDFLAWDLDPEDISFDHVVEVAQTIHEILEKIEIKSYCKTSGGRGLHIYIPLDAQYDYDQVQHFAQIIAIMTHERLPKITSLERMPAKRQQKVYIDTLQNEHSKTLVSPYCIRPKPHAPSSMPLKWSEVKPGLNPANFNIRTTLERVEKLGDIFKPVLGRGVNFKKSLKLLEREG